MSVCLRCTFNIQYLHFLFEVQIYIDHVLNAKIFQATLTNQIFQEGTCVTLLPVLFCFLSFCVP